MDKLKKGDTITFPVEFEVRQVGNIKPLKYFYCCTYENGLDLRLKLNEQQITIEDDQLQIIFAVKLKDVLKQFKDLQKNFKNQNQKPQKSS